MGSIGWHPRFRWLAVHFVFLSTMAAVASIERLSKSQQQMERDEAFSGLATRPPFE
jgi:hypothetical protein